MPMTLYGLPSPFGDLSCIFHSKLFSKDLNRRCALARDLLKILKVGIESSERHADFILYDGARSAPKNRTLPSVCFHWASQSCLIGKRLPFDRFHGHCRICESSPQPDHHPSEYSSSIEAFSCLLHPTLFKDDRKRRWRLCRDLVSIAKVDIESSMKYADLVLYDATCARPTDCPAELVCYHWAYESCRNHKRLPPTMFNASCPICQQPGTSNEHPIVISSDGEPDRPLRKFGHNHDRPQSGTFNLPHQTKSSRRTLNFPVNKSVRRPEKLQHIPALPASGDSFKTASRRFCPYCDVDIPHPPAVNYGNKGELLIKVNPHLVEWMQQFARWVLKLDPSHSLRRLLRDIRRMVNVDVDSYILRAFLSRSSNHPVAQDILKQVEKANSRSGLDDHPRRVDHLIADFLRAHYGPRPESTTSARLAKSQLNTYDNDMQHASGSGTSAEFALNRAVTSSRSTQFSSLVDRTSRAVASTSRLQRTRPRSPSVIEILSDDEDDVFVRRRVWRKRTTPRSSPSPMQKRRRLTGPLPRVRASNHNRVSANVIYSPPAVEIDSVRADEEEEDESSQESVFRPVAHIFKRHVVAPSPPRETDLDDDEDHAWHCWFLDFLDWCLERNPRTTKAEVYKAMAQATNNAKYRVEFAQMGYRLDSQVKTAFKRRRPSPEPVQPQDVLPDEANGGVSDTEEDLHGDLGPVEKRNPDGGLSDDKSDDEEVNVDDEEAYVDPMDVQAPQARLRPPAYGSSEPEDEPEDKVSDDDDDARRLSASYPSNRPSPSPSHSGTPSVPIVTSASKAHDDMQQSTEEILAQFAASQAPLMTPRQIACMARTISYLKDKTNLEPVWHWMSLIYRDSNADWKIAYDNHRDEVHSAILACT